MRLRCPMRNGILQSYQHHRIDWIETILMKNNNKKNHEHEHGGELEILKAVAQAWYGHSSNSRATSEFDARRLSFNTRPSRFRIEAMNKNNSLSKGSNTLRRKDGSGYYWDFGQSLWDSYEILAVSRKLETGLVSDHPFSNSQSSQDYSRKRESQNSLRSLFNLMSSRRFNESRIRQ